MAAATGLVRTAANTAVASQTFTDANMTETPTAALFHVVAATVDGTARDGIRWSVGATDGTNQWATGCSDEHGVGTTNAARRGVTDEVILILDFAGGIDGEANFVSFGAGSVTVNWGNLPSSAWLVTVYLFTVDNADARTYNPADTVGGTVTVTPNFQSTLIFASSDANLFDDSEDNHALLSFGACDASLNQLCISTRFATGLAAETIKHIVRSNRIYTDANNDAAHEITSITATTFVVTSRDTNGGTAVRVGYLALDTGSIDTFVGAINIPNAAANQSYNVGFESQIAGFGLSLGEAYDTTYQNDLADSSGVGVATPNDEFCNVVTADDGAGTTNNQSLSDNKIIVIPDSTGAADIEADWVSFTTPNVTVDFTNVSANVKKGFIWAIEVGTPPVPPDAVGFITAPVETFSKPSYELWLTNDFGVRIAQLTTFLTLEASRVVNQPGSFNVTMPPSFDENLIQPDRMVQFWRAPRGGRLALWRVYFIRKWKFASSGSDQITSFGGPDILSLLRRRIVAAFAASAEADKTDFADDIMKEVVTQSLADGVAPTPDEGTRVWNDLSIASDLGLGPTITKSFPFKKLMTSSGQGVLPLLAKAAREAGTEVFFDIVPNVITSSSANYQFQTFTGQPGQDHTSRVVFEERKNMKDPSLEYDYTEEENYIYAAGKGEEADREVVQVADSDRYSISQWGRIEGVADSRNQSGDGVRESGRDKLNDGRPRIRFSATPLDVSGTRFSRDWDFGDKVKAKFRNIEFDTIIRAVTISVNENGEESIGARLDFEN